MLIFLPLPVFSTVPVTTAPETYRSAYGDGITLAYYQNLVKEIR